ncbi:MAG TPA: rod shape-determining protein MreC [Clostridia bacterium]|nr:rod shape-determining protein MreC [Clostridia bacterium]HQO69108.1 rod shape-determining protein MreC [Clostridia bacterium]
MKLLKNRKFQIILIIAVFIVVAVLSINRFSGVNIIRNLVTIPITWIQKGINKADEYFAQKSFTRKQFQELLEENKVLKAENEDLREQNAGMSFLQDENQLLRDALSLKEIFDGYNIIGSNIMGSDPGNFVYRYKIDIGTRDKVKQDMPVVAANNALYGRIYSVNYTTSVIIPIIDENAGISGWISKEKGGHVNIKGDIRYKEDGLCLIENVSDSVELVVGDVVETSGFGGIYPKGILVGVIVEIFHDEITNERYGVLEPYVDFNSINTVFVMMEKTE